MKSSIGKIIGYLRPKSAVTCLTCCESFSVLVSRKDLILLFARNANERTGNKLLIDDPPGEDLALPLIEILLEKEMLDKNATMISVLRYKGTACAQLLLDQGAHIDLFDDFVGFFLRKACREGNENIVLIILQNSQLSHGSYHAKFIVSDALNFASKYGHVHIVLIILSSGINVLNWDSCALEQAAKNGHVEVVRILLTHGFPMYKHGKNAALFHACENGHTVVVWILLRFGAVSKDVDRFVDADLVTGWRMRLHAADANRALGIAHQKGHEDIEKILLQHGAKWDLWNRLEQLGSAVEFIHGLFLYIIPFKVAS
jgi:hypothetical protein